MRTVVLFLFVMLVTCGCGEHASTATSGASSTTGAGAAGSSTGSGGSGASLPTTKEFPTSIEVKNLVFFARKGVTDGFLNKAGKVYEAMLGDAAPVDAARRETYLSACKNQHIFQRVGLSGPANYPNSMDAQPGGAYQHNATDYIFELSKGGKDQLGEVVEHLLHTVTAVGFKLAFAHAWDFTNTASQLSLAMKESIDNGSYDVSSYEELKKDPEAYQRVLAQEYAYWLILAEWDFFAATGKKAEGMTGNDEFALGTPQEIATKNPLGHSLYNDYVVKVLTAPDPAAVGALFP